jgi:hypothetical protein
LFVCGAGGWGSVPNELISLIIYNYFEGHEIHFFDNSLHLFILSVTLKIYIPASSIKIIPLLPSKVKVYYNTGFLLTV